jgi:hypothetical protein
MYEVLEIDSLQDTEELCRLRFESIFPEREDYSCIKVTIEYEVKE